MKKKQKQKKNTKKFRVINMFFLIKKFNVQLTLIIYDFNALLVTFFNHKVINKRNTYVLLIFAI